MTKDNIIKLLKLLNAKNITPKDNWVMCSCLFASDKHKNGDTHPSAGIAINKHGVSGYSCLGCHTNFTTLEALLGELSMRNIEQKSPNLTVNNALLFLEDEDMIVFDTSLDISSPNEKSFFPFPDTWLESFSKVGTVPIARDYLNGRAIPPMVWDKLDLRFDHAKQCIGFPYRNALGRVAGMRGRCIDTMSNLKHFDYSYQNKNNTSLTWYREYELDASLPLIVVEGPFDAARVYQLYRNVTSLFTSGASAKKLQRLTYFPSVFGLSDNDPAGNGFRDAAKKFFSKTSTIYTDIVLPEEYNDPCEMPVNLLKYVLNEHKEHLTLNEIIL